MKIIYVEDARKYKLPDSDKPDSEVLKTLRATYSSLERHLRYLPQTVGVLTHETRPEHEIWANEIKSDSTFLPLEYAKE